MGPQGLREVAERKQVQARAGRADFPIDAEAALQGVLVDRAEETFVLPAASRLQKVMSARGVLFATGCGTVFLRDSRSGEAKGEGCDADG